MLESSAGSSDCSHTIKVVHIGGQKNIADSLSRLVPRKQQKQEPGDDEEYVWFIAVNATPRALTTREIEQASAEDVELQEVRRAIDTGKFDGCKPYIPVAGELCQVGQLVLRGTRIVIPQKLKARVLALAHEGHLGIVGTKQNLRSKVWWPGMDKAAERHCKSCHGCQLVSRPDPPEPMSPTQLPEGPWQDLAVDLMGPLPSGHSLLVVVDYYSRFYEVAVMHSTTADKVIDCLDDTFSRYGLPMTLKSDNGPQFVSQEFKSFCNENGITHCRTTARWAQANGEVERQNESILKRLRIAQAEGKDWRRELRRYLSQYRGLTHPTTGRSPAELLFRRKLRGKIPQLGLGDAYLDQEVRDRDAEQKAKGKLYADNRRNAQYSHIEVGDHVLMRQDKTNKLSTTFGEAPHQVVSKSGNSLVIESPDGAQYGRNTTHVKKYVEPDTSQDVEAITEADTTPSEASTELPNPLRRTQRTIKRPKYYEDFV